ncbi:hypothetical protein ACFLQ6_04875 [Thermoproteota archaeon]
MFKRPPLGVLTLGLGHIIVGTIVLLRITSTFWNPVIRRGEVYQSGEAEFVGFIGGIITLFLLIIVPIIILVGVGLLLQSETAYDMTMFGAGIWIAIGGIFLFLTRGRLLLFFVPLVYGLLTLIYFEKFVMTQSRRKDLLNKALTSLNEGDPELAEELLYKVRSFRYK